MRQSMELTLRWAERSRRYFEAHRDEVPWAKDHVGADFPAFPGKRELVEDKSNRIGRTNSEQTNCEPAELRSAGQVGTPAPTHIQAPGLTQTQALFGIVQGWHGSGITA